MIISVRTLWLVALLTFAAAAANAATYTVTKTEDTNDGVCDADCSLREALAAANADVASDIIVFDGSVFHTPQTYRGQHGDRDLRSRCVQAHTRRKFNYSYTNDRRSGECNDQRHHIHPRQRRKYNQHGPGRGHLQFRRNDGHRKLRDHREYGRERRWA